MTGARIRRWWLRLASRPALVAPLPLLAAAWLAFVTGWIPAEGFCAAVLGVQVFGFASWTARLSLVLRWLMTRAGWRLP